MRFFKENRLAVGIAVIIKVYWSRHGILPYKKVVTIQLLDFLLGNTGVRYRDGAVIFEPVKREFHPTHGNLCAQLKRYRR